MKRMLRKHAMECAVHQAVRKVVVNHLVLHGNAHKQVCLEEAGFPFVEEYIRWDYLREQIEEELGEEIIPVAARFWKMTDEARRLHPKRALASGYGKKTAGFVLVSWSPEIAQRYLAHKEAIRRGITTGANGTVETLRKHNVPLIEDGGALRDIDDVHELLDPDQTPLPLPSV